MKAAAKFGVKGASETTVEPIAGGVGSDRALTLLVEGAVRQMPQIDVGTYSSFCERVNTLAMQMPDRLPEEEKLQYVKCVLKEFETYQATANAMQRERLISWRTLTSKLLNELFTTLGIEVGSSTARSIISSVAGLNSAEDIAGFITRIREFLHPACPESETDRPAAQLHRADRTTANDNAAGLRGGGAAVEHVKRLKQRHGKGFIAVFRLSFLDVISERFGIEAVQDCIMAVAAYLTQSLRSVDAVYHWSDMSLMGVLEDRTNPRIAAAELSRITAQNRNIAIDIAGRTVMFRVPIEFELIPIDHFSNAEDLNWVSGQKAVRG